MGFRGFPAPALALEFERGEGVGKAFAAELGIGVAELEVEMGLGGVAGIAYQAEDLAAADVVADLDAQRAGLHVGIEGEHVVGNLYDDVVAADCFERHGDGARISGNVLLDAVFGIRDDAVRHCVDFVDDNGADAL